MDKYKKRHNARIVAAQTLYSIIIDPAMGWQDALRTITILDQTQNTIFDEDFAHLLIQTALAKSDEFDASLSPLMKNGIYSIPTIERAILWIACVELNQKPRIVSKSIILNESLNLIKEFSDLTNVKFLNALLDRYADLTQNEPTNTSDSLDSE